MEEQKEQTPSQEHGPAGPEQGLRSASTAGDSHGETTDAPSENTSTGKAGEQSPGERRKELLKKE